MEGKRRIIVPVLTRIVVSLVLVAIAVVIFSALYRTRPVPERLGDARATPRIQVFAARPVPVVRRWDGFGTALAMDSADVPARVTATVAEIPPDVLAGAPVRRGQPMLRLDPSDFQRQVEIAVQAIADLDAQLLRLEVETRSWQERVELAADEVRLARAEYERVLEASEKGAAKQREVDAAKQALVRAMDGEIAARSALDTLAPGRAALRARRAGQEAVLRIARQDLARCEVVSPLDGFVQEVDVEVGEQVQAGQRAVRVVSLRRIEVPLRLPAGARPFLSIGDEVALRSTGSTTLAWVGQVARIAPEDDPATRTTTVFVELAQDPAARATLAPGSFVRGSVESPEPAPRWVVPRRAMRSQRILTVRDGVVRGRDVEVAFQTAGSFAAFGLPDTQWVVLRDGLDEGTMIVVNAAQSLPEGAAVEPFVGAGARAMAAEPAASGAPGATPFRETEQ